ncbi:MAG: hypothetical protein ACWGQW_02390 [bacterium]
MGVKATFDPTVQRIYIHSGEIELDVKADLYSDAKEDWLNIEGYSKYEFPFSVIGGDPTVGAQFISPYFFMIEDWHLQPFEADHELTLIGNLFRSLGGSVAKPTSGEYTVSIDRITTITLVESGAGSLTTEEHNQLMSLPELAEIEASSVLAKETSVDALPTLGEIEGSSVLAKETTVSARPTLAEIEASTVLAKQAELLRALGLMQENYALDQTSWIEYQGQKLMTSGRLRIYSNAGSVGTGSNVIATYLITANWTDNELDDYSVVKQ